MLRHTVRAGNGPLGARPPRNGPAYRRSGGPTLLAVAALTALTAGCSGSSSGAAAPGPATTSLSGSAGSTTTGGGAAGQGTPSDGTGGSAATGIPPVPTSVRSGTYPVPASALPSATRTTLKTPALFSTPSGDIACAMQGLTVRCDIRRHTWKAPAKPASCDVDYGNGLTISGGKVEFTCAGDTVLGQQEILPYGEAVLSGTAVCSSLRSGVRCVDLTSRHGFLLARDTYQIF